MGFVLGAHFPHPQACARRPCVPHSLSPLLRCLSLAVEFAMFFAMGSTVASSVFPVLRVFRVFRMLRLIKSSKDIRVLLETLWYSLPSLANISSLLLLLFFVFAVMGMNLFGRIRQGEYLTHLANFSNFPLSLLTLFRMSTGLHEASVWQGLRGGQGYVGAQGWVGVWVGVQAMQEVPDSGGRGAVSQNTHQALAKLFGVSACMGFASVFWAQGGFSVKHWAARFEWKSPSNGW